MQRIFTVFTAALFLALSAFAPPASAAAVVGEDAPAFTAKNSAGKDVSLAGFKGKVVVLEWVNGECPFVKKHYDSGNMQKLQKEAAEKGVVWLSVNSAASKKPGYLEGDAAAAWLKTVEASPAEYLIDAAGDLGRLYGAKTTPHMFVIDKAGKTAYAGAIDSLASVSLSDVPKADNYVRDALKALEEGKPVAIASVAPYGCSVKYAE